MRLNARLMVTLILAHAFAVSVNAADGPIQLDAAGMDAVTAGSTNPVLPTHTSSAAQALQGLPSFYSPFTSSGTPSLPAGSAASALAWLQSLQAGGGAGSVSGTGTGGTSTTASSGTGDSQDDESSASNSSNAASDALANLGLGAGTGNNANNAAGGLTNPTVTVIPNTGGIDFTRVTTGSDMTIYMPQAPAGHLRDFFHHSVQNQW